ncbi:hypothetical protein [Desulfosarcina variabilis]|uniref:hypothetical protein n=1 Tax=Desulfosarcina variabilis TaxID=2300 RepID=UPI003AFAAEC3
MKSIIGIAFFFGAFTAFMLSGCRIVSVDSNSCTKEGHECGNVIIAWGEADEYYERGVEYARCECFDLAIDDFKMAISESVSDQWDYLKPGDWTLDLFPRRELGIIYYKMHNYEDAERYLELSLSQTYSDKANYFLNLTRRALVQSTPRPFTTPKIILDEESGLFLTRANPVVVSGFVEDDNYIEKCLVYVQGSMINGKLQRINRPQKHLRFRETFNLLSGLHEIKIEATNLKGIPASRKVTVQVDREGPDIFFEPIGEGAYQNIRKWSINGYLTDEAGAASLTIDGQPVDLTLENHFSHVVDSMETVTVIAKDILGNATHSYISPDSLMSTKNQPLLASLMSSQAGFYSLQANVREVKISFEGFFLEANHEVTIYQESMPLQFSIENADKLKSLEIRNEGSGYPPIKIYRFPTNIQIAKLTKSIKLKMGKNKIVFCLNKQIPQEKIVIRKLPAPFEPDQRMELVIDKESILNTNNESFKRSLIKTLQSFKRFNLNASGGFEETNKTWILKINNKSSQDRNTLIHDTADGKIIYGVVINAKNKSHLVYADVFHTNKLGGNEDKENEAWAELLAKRVLMEFPLFSGFVKERNKNRIYTDFGYEIDLQGRGLIVYHHSDNSNVDVMERAEIQAVTPRFIEAKLVSKNSQAKSMDQVISE